MAQKRIKRPRDPLVLAHLVGRIATGQVEDQVEDTRNPHAVELGRLGGQRGGAARREALPAKRRKEIARKAALKRWAAKHRAD